MSVACLNGKIVGNTFKNQTGSPLMDFGPGTKPLSRLLFREIFIIKRSFDKNGNYCHLALSPKGRIGSPN